MPHRPAALAFRRVLVVAPHPDDDTLGCGGLLWHLARRGAAFHVVFVTDGGASHRNSRSWPRPRLAAEREREACEALSRLGLGEAARTFLRLADADMPAGGTRADEDALEAVCGIVADLRPDLALLPWRRDPHCDHRDAWTLVTRALASAGAKPATLEYAVWLDEIGQADDRPRADEAERVEFDISAALTAKRAALSAHRTQLGGLIDDDPDGFRLTPFTIDRLVTPTETYWRPL